MKKYVISAILTLFATIIDAQESQTGYNFLRLPVSAHAAALGGDNITLIEDDEALIFHNPALLSSVNDKTVNLNYMNYMSGVNTASIFSPVPTNIMGLSTTVRIERAAPPRVSPSSLVSTTPS